jgi:hypothetical protein
VDDSQGVLSFSYSNIGDIDSNQAYLWNIYLDSDNQASSGYNFELMGADYLLQGASLYRYTGTGENWSWEYLGEVDYVASGNRAELSLAKQQLGLGDEAGSYRALFYGTDASGNDLDYLLLDTNPGGAVVIMEEISAPSGGA